MREGRPGESVFMRLDLGESLQIQSDAPLPCVFSVVSLHDHWNRNWHQSIVSEGLQLKEGSVIWSVMPQNAQMLAVTRVEASRQRSSGVDHHHWFLPPEEPEVAEKQAMQEIQSKMIQSWLAAGYPASSNADPIHLFWPAQRDQANQQRSERLGKKQAGHSIRFVALEDVACVLGVAAEPQRQSTDLGATSTSVALIIGRAAFSQTTEGGTTP